MISKTKINKRTRKKTNTELAETILLAKKNNTEIAKLLSGPTRKNTVKNLDGINKEAKQGETIIIPGKVLGTGSIDKKITIIGLSFSSAAEEKLKKAGCEILKLRETLIKNKNKKLEGKILR